MGVQKHLTVLIIIHYSCTAGGTSERPTPIYTHLLPSHRGDRNRIVQPQVSARAWTDYVYKGKMKSRDIPRKADAPFYS